MQSRRAQLTGLRVYELLAQKGGVQHALGKVELGLVTLAHGVEQLDFKAEGAPQNLFGGLGAG